VRNSLMTTVVETANADAPNTKAAAAARADRRKFI